MYEMQFLFIMKKRNLQFSSLIGLAIAVTLLGIYFYKQDVIMNPFSSESPSTSPSATKYGATPKPLSYTEAVRKYGDHRIQFDANCQGFPAGLTVKNGTSLMFDNRSAKARTLYIDKKPYGIKAYGYIVLPMKSAILPHLVQVSCDKQPNVINIFIER